MKKILILGGGANQLGLIQAAKNAGIQVILCDYNPNATGIPLADRFYQVSIIDREAVLEVAKKEKVDGIVANTEAVMQLVAYVCETLGLPGNTEEAVEKLVSKKSFRQLQKTQGLFAPGFREVDSWPALQEAVTSVGFPAIIKPSESSGTRGTAYVTEYTSAEKIRKAYETCRNFSRNGLVTIENYIPMPSLTVIEGDIFVNHGEFLWEGLFFTRRSPMAPMIPMTYIFPLELEPEKMRRVRQDLYTAMTAAGIRHGQYNVELYFTGNDDLFLIEINARQGGNKIPLAIKMHSGIDMDRLLVTTAVGDDSYWNQVKNSTFPERYTAWHLVFPRKAGVLQEVCISDEIQGRVIYKELFCQPGAEMENTENAASCIGYVGLRFDNAAQMHAYCERLEELIRPVIV